MSDDEKAIREVVTTWMAATKAGDSATVLGLMTDDVMFLVPGMAPFGKAEFAAATKEQSSASVHFDGKSEILELKVVGDWAYIVTKLKVTTTTDNSEPGIRAGHTLSILRKQNGKWQLARDANLLAPVRGD
jgi:uncharacterized protein (TIGR02246 family)